LRGDPRQRHEHHSCADSSAKVLEWLAHTARAAAGAQGQQHQSMSTSSIRAQLPVLMHLVVRYV
jgi:hypothetical protein